VVNGAFMVVGVMNAPFTTSRVWCKRLGGREEVLS
jgi:hypothetical protein